MTVLEKLGLSAGTMGSITLAPTCGELLATHLTDDTVCEGLVYLAPSRFSKDG